MATLKIKGEKHVVTKNKKGEVTVDHPQQKKSKYKKINLTKADRAKTVSQGVKSVKKWHKKNG